MPVLLMPNQKRRGVTRYCGELLTGDTQAIIINQKRCYTEQKRSQPKL